MQMLTETMVAALRKGNVGCFTCGNKNHLKKGTALRKLIKKPPKICPCCRRGMHWAKECKSKFDIEGKPIPGNSKQGTPCPATQVSFNKKQGAHSVISLKPSTSGSAAIDIPALNDFLLYPQAVPSRIPTRLFGPLPPQPLVFYLADLA